MFDPKYFNVGDYTVQVAPPTNPLSTFLAGLFGVLFIIDVFHGNMFGAVLMLIFSAIHFVDVRRR